MPYKVAIRNNETGEVRVGSYEYDFNSCFFWWEEGNMACDCNRELEFARAGKTKEELKANNLFKDINRECSDGYFDVLYIESEGGRKEIIKNKHSRFKEVPNEIR
jgi:hypothetical protein